jgi:hypothetical protein
MAAVAERYTPSDANEWLKVAGTDPRYRGLHAVPHAFPRPTTRELAATPSSFPATTPPSDLIQSMIHIDESWDRVKKWRSSKESPPPVDEVVHLGEQYRELSRQSSSARGDAFLKMLLDAETAARELEAGMRNRDEAAIRSGFEKSQAACSRCHAKFRD